MDGGNGTVHSERDSVLILPAMGSVADQSLLGKYSQLKNAVSSQVREGVHMQWLVNVGAKNPQPPSLKVSRF